MPSVSIPVLQAQHQPPWPDRDKVERVRTALASAEPVVRASDILRLTAEIARSARGDSFILHAGECAEGFSQASPHGIATRARSLREAGRVLELEGRLPVVHVGRIAGQFAKPRSAPIEVRDGLSLLSYRGDRVNGHEFSVESRQPDPQRMLQAHLASIRTVRELRALQIRERLMGDSSWPEIFTSHESLVLDYEEPLVREVEGRLFDLSAHLLWVGRRTAEPGGPQMRFFSRIANPVAVKIGPGVSISMLRRIVTELNPDGEPGRLSLITRLGAERAQTELLPLLTAVGRDHPEVAWICDPMHGNTILTRSGVKTRLIDDILLETRAFFDAHARAGTVPAGISLEMAADDITECLGGTRPASNVTGLETRYEALCDPRLNPAQAVDVVRRAADLLRARRASATRSLRLIHRAASHPIQGAH